MRSADAAGRPVESRRPSKAVVALAFATVTIALRLPGLVAAPMFCDEAIYLRYAQLVARDPIGNALVSLVDPKPPLHFWLLAPFFRLGVDPLWGGRLLSVLAAAAASAVLVVLVPELLRLRRRGAGGPEEEWTTGVAALLFITCPFLAFYERMAMSESLLILESVVAAWLALRMARDAGTGEGSRATLRHALAFGAVVGLAMMTKQNASYVLWGLPWLALPARADSAKPGAARRLGRSTAVAAAIALTIWSPLLLTDRGPSLRERVFFRGAHAFVGEPAEMVRTAATNLVYAFVPATIRSVPGADPETGFAAPAEAGWLWVYLTPPVEILGLLGLLLLLGRRETRIFRFLAGWSALSLLPLLPSPLPYSRYALFCVPPLLLAAALLATSAIEALRGRIASPSLRAALAGLFVAAIAIWPALSLSAQIRTPERQRFVKADRWQFVSGWPAGGATREAIRALRAIASRENAIVVVTSNTAGVPTDAVWVEFDGEPGISVFFIDWADRLPVLHSPAAPGWVLLRAQFHHFDPRTVMVRLPPRVPVFFVVADHRVGSADAGREAKRLAVRNPELTEVARFSNPPMEPGGAIDDVVVFRVR
jgi:4-amino-4-deoxy-L-arabinose transferase-like glycosyltransferase